MAEDSADKEKSEKAWKIVRNHALGSVAAGILPVPLLGAGIYEGVQLRMLHQLAKLYDVEFSKQRATAILGALLGLTVASTAGSVLRMIPGVGQALGVISALAVPPASTYALGRVFIKHFESGGTFLTFDEERGKKEYKEEVTKKEREIEHYAGIKP